MVGRLNELRLGLWLGAGAAWFVLVRRAERLPLALVVSVAVLLRALGLASDLALSDDVHRYVWEGGLVAEGESPYAHAPNAPERAAERARWPDVFEALNNQEVSAAYPPVTQLANALVTSAAGGPEQHDRAILSLRAAYALFDLACLVPLVMLLRARGRPDGLAAIWGLSPLVTFEFAGSAHFDSLGVLLLLVGLVLFERSRERLGILALTAGVLVKFLPAFALPLAVRARGGGWRALVNAGLLAGGVFVVAWVPFMPGGGLTAGLSEYGLRWEAAPLLFRWIELPFDALFERDGGALDSRRLARLAALGIWSVVFVREWRRGGDAARSVGVLLGAFLVLSPTLHPWYLAWVLPFVALRRSSAWCVLFVLAPLAYWPLAGWQSAGVWEEPAWLWPVLALPFFALRLSETRGGGR